MVSLISMINHTYYTDQPKEEISTKKKVVTGCLTLLKYFIGIIFVGFLINLAMEKDEEHDLKYPWYGSMWYVGSNSIIDDGQFKTLEECREWAKNESEKKDLTEGNWDYSCGTNCSFSDQGISNGRKVNTFKCTELTK